MDADGPGSTKPRTRSTSAALTRPMSHIEADIVLQRSAAAPLATSSGPSEPRTAAVASARPAPTGAGSSCVTHGRPVTDLPEDVDDKYRNDPQMVTHYVNQIHDYLREAQVRLFMCVCVYVCVCVCLSDVEMQGDGEMMFLRCFVFAMVNACIF